MLLSSRKKQNILSLLKSQIKQKRERSRVMGIWDKAVRTQRLRQMTIEIFFFRLEQNLGR